MPRRRRLPPDIDPKRPHGVGRTRVPKHECPHCNGVTRPLVGQTLDEAVAIHEASCPAIHRVRGKEK